jgi:hypothetical protein
MALFCWPGTSQEFDALLSAVDTQCKARGRNRADGADPEFEGQQCQVDPTTGQRTTCCGAHTMLTDDKIIHHLLFVRREYGKRLVAEEMTSGVAVAAR